MRERSSRGMAGEATFAVLSQHSMQLNSLHDVHCVPSQKHCSACCRPSPSAQSTSRILYCLVLASLSRLFSSTRVLSVCGGAILTHSLLLQSSVCGRARELVDKFAVAALCLAPFVSQLVATFFGSHIAHYRFAMRSSLIGSRFPNGKPSAPEHSWSECCQ
ncbi:unnamed protein product [Periconia digitata]|uniref:Uncharacterized protein n=1 Tax=Periconia digitata TaxID=1303443 RepID=A0A9W4XPH8_9PLEO|nr:unnamed protein product [Periconia digitata]